MIRWLRKKFDDWFIDAVKRFHVVEEMTLLQEIEDAKEDVWSDTASKDDLDNLEYEVSHNEEAIDELDDELREWLDQLENTMEDFRRTIDEQRKQIKEIEEEQLETLQHAVYDIIKAVITGKDIEELDYLRAFKEWYEENYKTFREWYEESKENKE